MLMQITYEFNPILAEKGLEWDLQIAENIEIMCDADKLERAIDNLIRNAVNYSDQKFVCIDNCIVGMDNVVSVGGNCNEGCYIAGVFCAMLTTRTEIPHINPEKKVAYVSGKDTPYGLDGYAGFVQGVHDVDPEIEVITVYGDSFSDPAGMKEWVLSAIEAGADCMYAMAGNGVYGAIEGCQEGGAYLVGHDGNYDEAGAGYVATSFCRAMYIPVVQVVYDFRAGNWDGDSVYLCTFTNGGLGFTNGDYFKQMVGEDVFPQDIVGVHALDLTAEQKAKLVANVPAGVCAAFNLDINVSMMMLMPALPEGNYGPSVKDSITYFIFTAPNKTDDQKRELVKNVYKATCDAVGELPKNKCIVIFKEHADNNVGVDGVLRVDAKKNGTFHV